jgi:phosphonate transport system permease protein
MADMTGRFAAGDLGPAARDYARAARARQARALAGLAVLLGCVVLAGWVAEVRPLVLAENIGSFTHYIALLFYLDSGNPVWTAPADWLWGWRRWLSALGETILMAYAGSLLGALAGFVLCFVTSRNFCRSAALRFSVRRFLEFSRTVPDIVFALIFVIAFGLGPVPGVLAIAVHTMGALGKQFAEVVENIDLKPVEGIAGCGGGRLAQIRFGALPQVQSNFISYALLRFEINVRSAAVLGFAGAGGIGYLLLIAVRKFYYSDVSAMLLLIIATVMLIDGITERLRHALLGRPER